MINGYLHRLYDTVISRGYVDIDQFTFDNPSNQRGTVHFPNLPTYPHHKHVGTAVEPAQPPDLSDVLREIEQFLFESD